ncbi:MAG: hypothetical protein Q8O92_12840 [Candidatus Latescibacter sp.]|nr:hypothetical protein [Candidatus Latescibacter sp.]
MSGLIKKTIIGLFCLLICGVIYALKIKEKRKFIVEIERVKAEEVKSSQLRFEFKSVNEEEKEKWKIVEGKFYSVLFPGRDALQLIEELAKIAKECNISDISFNTDYTIDDSLQKAYASTFEDISIKVDCFAVKFSLQCQYQELARFIDGIENLRYLVEIESMEIKRGIPLITADLVVKAYYSKEENHAQK